MNRRKNVFLLIGVMIIMLLSGSMISYGDTISYWDGVIRLEKLDYLDAKNVAFDYITVEENMKYLAPGIKEIKTIALENGEMQHVDYTCEIDLNNGTTEILLGHRAGQLMSVPEQIVDAEARTGKNVVAGVNGCFFTMETAVPDGLLVSNGKVLYEARLIHPTYDYIHLYENIFVITSEGEAKILNTRDLCYDVETDTYTPIQDGQFQFAISGNAIVLKPNASTGEPEVVNLVDGEDSRSQKHARTAVGIKDDGSVVLFSTSGKMSPFNHGYSCTELGMIMKEKGCHTAMLLDGGGSSTYVSQYPGETKDVCRTFSSEGTPRNVCAGILVATTASQDGVFSKVEGKALQDGLSPCEEEGHEYMHTGENVTCRVCGRKTPVASYSGLATEKKSGKTEYFVKGRIQTGYVPYDMFEMYYFDQKGLSCQTKLTKKQMPACTDSGSLEFYCEKAPKSQKTFSFQFPKATGHEYTKKKQGLVCKNCGWQAVDLDDCKITVANAGYSGKAKKPTVSMTTPDGIKLKRKGDGSTGDYQRTVSNNVEIGMAEMKFSPIVYYVNMMEERSSVIGERTVKFPILPYPAKNLKAAKSGFNYVNLSWSPSASAGGDYEIIYEVYMKQGAKWKKVNSTKKTSCQIKGLKKATTYTFGVSATAVGKDGKTYASWSKAEKAVSTAGLKPPSVKASNVAETGKVKLTWKSVKGADAYRVYRATSKNGKYTLLKTVEKTSYVHTGATVGKLYYYKVSAIDRDDKQMNSDLSKYVSRRCDLKRPVVKVSTEKRSGKPKLTWKKVKGAEKYKIYRATKKNGTYKYLNTTTKAVYVNKNAKKGKTYWYKVQAMDAQHTSAASASSTAKNGKCK